MVHGTGQRLGVHGRKIGVLKILADLVILAKDTAQIATGKKDGPRPPLPGDGRLLAMMETDVGHQGLGADAAEPNLAGQPVDPALARATAATAQLFKKMAHGGLRGS
jgi:hypothetical protein